MKLGFFTMPIHPLDKDWRTTLREDREAFLLADKLGFVEGYVGEHATDRAENITSCAMFIASLIDDATSRHPALTTLVGVKPDERESEKARSFRGERAHQLPHCLCSTCLHVLQHPNATLPAA